MEIITDSLKKAYFHLHLRLEESGKMFDLIRENFDVHREKRPKLNRNFNFNFMI